MSSGRTAPLNAAVMLGRFTGAAGAAAFEPDLAEDVEAGWDADSDSVSPASSARWRRRASVRSVRLARATSSSCRTRTAESDSGAG